MEEQVYFLNHNLTLAIVFLVSTLFAVIGIIYSKKHQGIENYLTANRNIGVTSLTTSLVASALGAWILFGPASAATWGGIGSVIGYSLGTAFPMIALIYLGVKMRKIFPKGKTLTEFVKRKFGKNLFKLILFLMIFYMFIFLCAEVTAISMLINYISGTSLWITALLVIVATLAYTLYGGLRASILTDNFQFFIVLIFLLICAFYIFSFNSGEISLNLIKNNSNHLISSEYLPNYTAGLTFFIAVAATNLFHQGNWQRVFAAKNEKILKQSLWISFFIIIPIVFFMGVSGLIAISLDSKINPDLAFFTILLKENTFLLSILIIIMALSLTISTVDTLVNAISSLVVVEGRYFFADYRNKNFLKLSKIFLVILSIFSFIIASKGFSILYLFLLADLFCCAAVITVFSGFYKKKIKETNAFISILIGLLLGLLLFPSPDFTQSILVGILFSSGLFPQIITSYLLFWSFLLATLSPVIAIISYDSFKR
ncbi:MAG: sodium:solute symporter [Pelagibacteraceae bacterium]|nr:sodium:solute symporter [Pelagibacteraceae bacterium]